MWSSRSSTLALPAARITSRSTIVQQRTTVGALVGGRRTSYPSTGRQDQAPVVSRASATGADSQDKNSSASRSARRRPGRSASRIGGRQCRSAAATEKPIPRRTESTQCSPDTPFKIEQAKLQTRCASQAAPARFVHTFPRPMCRCEHRRATRRVYGCRRKKEAATRTAAEVVHVHWHFHFDTVRPVAFVRPV